MQFGLIKGKYVALIPLYDEAAQMLEDSGELIILKVEEEDGETYLAPIEDEKEFNEIGQLFEERLSEAFAFEEDAKEDTEKDTN